MFSTANFITRLETPSGPLAERMFALLIACSSSLNVNGGVGFSYHYRFNFVHVFFKLSSLAFRWLHVFVPKYLLQCVLTACINFFFYYALLVVDASNFFV